MPEEDKNLPKKKNTFRVTAGYYRRYNGEWYYVVMVVKDMDTAEDIVILRKQKFTSPAAFEAMTLESFCSKVRLHGKVVYKFERLTDAEIEKWQIEECEEAGLRGPVRRKSKDPPELTVREYRRSRNYFEYAKDIIVNYKLDNKKYKLCVEMKRPVSCQSKEQFLFLKEDLLFFQKCMSTVLAGYLPFFKERYVQGVSIRKYAEAHGMNRGSVEHIQNKFFKAFAEELAQRDKSDNVNRLYEPPKWLLEDDDFEEDAE